MPLPFLAPAAQRKQNKNGLTLNHCGDPAHFVFHSSFSRDRNIGKLVHDQQLQKRYQQQNHGRGCHRQQGRRSTLVFSCSTRRTHHSFDTGNYHVLFDTGVNTTFTACQLRSGRNVPLVPPFFITALLGKPVMLYEIVSQHLFHLQGKMLIVNLVVMGFGGFHIIFGMNRMGKNLVKLDAASNRC